MVVYLVEWTDGFSESSVEGVFESRDDANTYMEENDDRLMGDEYFSSTEWEIE